MSKVSYFCPEITYKNLHDSEFKHFVLIFINHETYMNNYPAFDKNM